MQGMEKYIKKKQLDPLAFYIPPILVAQQQLKVRTDPLHVCDLAHV